MGLPSKHLASCFHFAWVTVNQSQRKHINSVTFNGSLDWHILKIRTMLHFLSHALLPFRSCRKQTMMTVRRKVPKGLVLRRQKGTTRIWRLVLNSSSLHERAQTVQSRDDSRPDVYLWTVELRESLASITDAIRRFLQDAMHDILLQWSWNSIMAGGFIRRIAQSASIVKQGTIHAARPLHYELSIKYERC